MNWLWLLVPILPIVLIVGWFFVPAPVKAGLWGAVRAVRVAMWLINRIANASPKAKAHFRKMQKRVRERESGGR